ncbi:hypothetical protein G3T14_02590 [Methylobacterium sp. BTF04]|uniref:hypothetical protein n=1 Tax=Methylobacterium sp. BTF04 TaxID=2708300 RepID=UPI0013D84DB7|nr:hypothetical protein [Methylobacterium sp. BTF04]NEU11020.1 hypothetical protein [Methylobacterium sp. BTF04]
MTDLLEQAVAIARSLPADVQDDIARMVLSYTGNAQPVIQLTPDEQADLEASEDEVARGAFASEAQMRAIWGKHDL